MIICDFLVEVFKHARRAYQGFKDSCVRFGLIESNHITVIDNSCSIVTINNFGKGAMSVFDKPATDIEEAIQPFVYSLRGPGAGGNSLFLMAKPSRKDELIEKLHNFEDKVVILYGRVNKRGLEILVS
jgi:hypothetical protein